MPQSHPAVPATAPMSPGSMLEAIPRTFMDDPEIPLGCECADPSLQIERWRQEAPGAGEPG